MLIKICILLAFFTPSENFQNMSREHNQNSLKEEGVAAHKSSHDEAVTVG